MRNPRGFAGVGQRSAVARAEREDIDVAGGGSSTGGSVRSAVPAAMTTGGFGPVA